MKTQDLLKHCCINLYALERAFEKTLGTGKAVAALMKLMRFSTGEKITERDLAIAKAADIIAYQIALKKHIDAGGQVRGMSNATVANVYHLCDAIDKAAVKVARQAKTLEDVPPASLFTPKLKSKVDTALLNTWLVDRLLSLQKGATEERKRAFESFFGVNGPAKTQSETGREFPTPITGERVRRIVNDVLSRFVLPYSDDEIAQHLFKMKVIDYDLSPFLDLFHDRKGALGCLEYVLTLHKGQLRNNELPKLPATLLYHVAGATGNAFTEDDIIREIKASRVMKGIPEGALPIVIREGDHEILYQNEDGTYYANPLPDPYYAAAILYHYPEGVSVNAMAMQSANDLDKRVGRASEKSYWANVLVRASNTGLAAISEPGYYKHIRFFDAILAQRDDILKKTKAYLKKHAGDGSLSLLHEIAPKLFPDMDYAGIRYIVSHLGEKKGVYFRGTSSIDMASLNPDVPILNLEEEVMRVLEKTVGPLSRDDISDAIWDRDAEHRPSVYHVIARLEEQGKMIKVGKGLYQAPKHAFKGIDLDVAERSVIALVGLMSQQGLNVELHALNAHVNEELGRKKALPPLWVAGFMKYHANRFDGKVDVADNIAAKAGETIESVNTLGKAILRKHPDFKSADFVDALQSKIVIEPKQASIAYNYLHRKR